MRHARQELKRRANNMAGGMTYTAVESTALSTAEYYGKTLVELGAEHPEVVALTADLGKSTNCLLYTSPSPRD